MEDLDLIAELGVSRLRYPVLWERTAPGALEAADWSWADARLERLQALHLPPIVTLLHHGSGPAYTSLIDAAFPEHLATYARAVARRYPHVDAYTPVNEPLTTARFSGLYGHWYPHGHDDWTFVRALLHQCTGTVLAMRAIREVNPTAQLVHTEDLGFTHTTPALAYQGELENERRWLSLDLICGHVDRLHPLWSYLQRAGAHRDELLWFVDNPCPPDILGFNYYVTSERFLDEDLARWPVWSHGGNGRHAYADVHAALAGRCVGVDVLLTQAWERYRLPVALTEVHMGCTREEQLRWVVEIHERVQIARRRGVPVVATTAWSVFGAYDWHCLVTRCEDRYEPGLFDVRGPRPRPTALAKLWRSIARGERPQHASLTGTPWWRRALRVEEAAA